MVLMRPLREYAYLNVQNWQMIKKKTKRLGSEKQTSSYMDSKNQKQQVQTTKKTKTKT